MLSSGRRGLLSSARMNSVDVKGLQKHLYSKESQRYQIQFEEALHNSSLLSDVDIFDPEDVHKMLQGFEDQRKPCKMSARANLRKFWHHIERIKHTLEKELKIIYALYLIQRESAYPDVGAEEFKTTFQLCVKLPNQCQRRSLLLYVQKLVFSNRLIQLAQNFPETLTFVEVVENFYAAANLVQLLNSVSLLIETIKTNNLYHLISDMINSELEFWLTFLSQLIMVGLKKSKTISRVQTDNFIQIIQILLEIDISQRLSKKELQFAMDNLIHRTSLKSYDLCPSFRPIPAEETTMKENTLSTLQDQDDQTTEETLLN